jgi:hypothetical protein
MTNIQNNFAFPTHLYQIDSWKLMTDKSNFINVNIPSEFTTIDKETGSIIRDFKANSLPIPYKNGTIYIAQHNTILKGVIYEKIAILFSSKICGDDYFNGIKLHQVKELMEHIKTIGYFDFKDSIYDFLYVKDLDIKKDFTVPYDRLNDLKKFNQDMVDRCNGTSKAFSNQKQGIGLQANDRANSTFSNPFCKFYSKSTELLGRKAEFFSTLSYDIQTFVRNNYIYRFEFTIKDKKWFDKFEISNKLVDVMEIPNSKWNEIARWFLDTNFQYKPKRTIDTSKLTPLENVMAIMMIKGLSDGWSYDEIRLMFIQSSDTNNDHKHRMISKFEKLYNYINSEHNTKLYDSLRFIDEWYSFLGFK